MNRKTSVCAGVDEYGELIWEIVPMELWQILKFYYQHYSGDFGEQWMWLVLQEKGMDWPFGEEKLI